MQAVIELPLESPLELSVIEVPGMKFEIVGMHWNRRISKLDENFHGLALGPGRKIKQRVLVKLQLSQHTFKPQVRVSHLMILTGVVIVWGGRPRPPL